MTEISPVLWEVLDSALGDVEAGWQEVAEDSPSQVEVRGLLATLRQGIERAAAEPKPPDPGLPRTVLSRRLADLVRRSLLVRLAALTPAPEGRSALALLNAMEAVHRALEPDWAQHFADRLSGPDGMELVVEVAHDLRSPLTSILFLAETLQRGRSGPINHFQERQLGLIYSAAFGLSSLASDVIELARGGDRLVDLDPLPFSISDILESVRDIVQPIAEEKGLQVRLGMPESDFRVGHPVALSRVLLNLTTNALKFTSDGFVEVRGDQREGSLMEFSVRDTGRGIPPHAMLTLFEPFRRRQKQGEYAFSGAGLGLSICRKLVEAMHASLKVETSPESGTRFFFQLDLPLASDRP
ncbi:MAG TPA: HAMP domain-containing sensor histidine kinase [Gemmatimonadales bacterium]|nr:HAMP domain-containing sensor histidine kinase [Gemmatimonadales bacterium]